MRTCGVMVAVAMLAISQARAANIGEAATRTPAHQLSVCQVAVVAIATIMQASKLCGTNWADSHAAVNLKAFALACHLPMREVRELALRGRADASWEIARKGEARGCSSVESKFVLGPER
jgi:hypothetical protein